MIFNPSAPQHIISAWKSSEEHQQDISITSISKVIITGLTLGLGCPLGGWQRNSTCQTWFAITFTMIFSPWFWFKVFVFRVKQKAWCLSKRFSILNCNEVFVWSIFKVMNMLTLLFVTHLTSQSNWLTVGRNFKLFVQIWSIWKSLVIIICIAFHTTQHHCHFQLTSSGNSSSSWAGLTKWWPRVALAPEHVKVFLNLKKYQYYH